MMETGNDDDDSVTSSTKIKSFMMVPEKNVERAKSQLDEIWDDAPENAPYIDEEGDPAWGPVVLCDKITWEDFDQWLEFHEGDVRRWIFEPLFPDHSDDEDDNDDGKLYGRVLLYSISSNVHAATAGKILQMIQEEVLIAGNDIRLIRTIRVAASPTCRLGPQRAKEPEMSLSPAGLKIGGSIRDNGYGYPFPQVVIEIAYKNESLSNLRQVIHYWMLPQTSVQVAIGIKIFVTSQGRPRRYRAIFAVRNSPTWEVEFGMEAGAGPMTLAFPMELFYEGAPFPPALANLVDPTITIDLITLRNFINAEFP